MVQYLYSETGLKSSATEAAGGLENYSADKARSKRDQERSSILWCLQSADGYIVYLVCLPTYIQDSARTKPTQLFYFDFW